MAAFGQPRPAPPAATRPVSQAGVRTPLFVLGVALSLVAFLIMFAFGIVYAGKFQAPGQVEIVVAKDPIEARTPLDPSMLMLKSFPVNAIPPKSYIRVADLNGAYAVVPLYAGEPITTNLVQTNADLLAPQSTYLPIPQGMVAMALPASELSDVGGYPAQGDYIDVVATVPLRLFTPNDSRSVTVIVFTSLYIIRVGPQTTIARQGQPQGVATSITVVLTPCDAVYLRWLQENTTLTFLLQSYKDYQTVPSPAPAASESQSQSQTPASASKPACPGFVGPAQADGRWKFTGP